MTIYRFETDFKNIRMRIFYQGSILYQCFLKSLGSHEKLITKNMAELVGSGVNPVVLRNQKLSFRLQ